MTEKIGYLVHRFPRLTLTFVLREILALEKMGLEIIVFSFRESDDAPRHPEYQQMAAPIVYVPKWDRSLKSITTSLFYLSRFLKYPGRLAKVIPFLVKNRDKKLWIDFLRAGWIATQLQSLGITHLHAYAASSAASVAMFAALLTDKSYSFTAHASDIFPRQEYLPRKLDGASFVVAISEYNRQFLMSLYDNESIGNKIHVMRYGIDLEQFPDFAPHPPSSSSKTFTILTVARLVEQKGHHVLIEALSILNNRGYDFFWVVVGSGPRKTVLEEMVKAKELSAYVDFKGDQISDVVMELLGEADIVVLPCIRTKKNMMDGIPNTLIEAMARGIPVVSTYISGIPELIEDGISGFLVPPEDAMALADILERIILNTELLKPLVVPARKKVEQDFSADTNAAVLYHLFAEHVSKVN